MVFLEKLDPVAAEFAAVVAAATTSLCKDLVAAAEVAQIGPA